MNLTFTIYTRPFRHEDLVAFKAMSDVERHEMLHWYVSMEPFPDDMPQIPIGHHAFQVSDEGLICCRCGRRFAEDDIICLFG